MKAVLIDRIQVTMEPWRFGDTPDIEMRIRIDTMGQQFNHAQVLRPSDIESHFDVYFESVKRQLLEALKKHAAEVARTESEVPA